MSLRMSQSMTSLVGSPQMTQIAGQTLSETQRNGAETRPRMLHQPNFFPDSEQSPHYQTGGTLDGKRAKMSATHHNAQPYCKPHGNSKPQAPPYHSTWSLTEEEPKKASWKISVHKNARMVNHMHAKPWSSSSCPGKREGETNTFRRQWMQEQGTRAAKWNRHEKKKFYDAQEKELLSKAPHDEMYCSARYPSNYKFWTHLNDGGTKPGGCKEGEKCSYSYNGANTATTHFYKGKFENVKHVQRIVQSGWKDPVTDELNELHKDTRPQFDNRLWDDARLHNELETQWASVANFETHRPHKSASCSQLGAMFCHR